MTNPLFRIGAALLNTPSPRPVEGTPAPFIGFAPPRRTGGMPLLDALAARHTSREFAQTPIDSALLGDLLWAADGINREGEGGRTAPSALGGYEIDIYVLLASGAYRYDPDRHALVLVAPADLRAMTGYQEFLGHAPVNLVYVADLTRMQDVPQAQREAFASASAGAMLQNVYLFCASMGLAAAARGWMNRTALAANLKLPAGSAALLAQTVGHFASGHAHRAHGFEG
ncbi:SagB/ThcOx family dehydrogenase [Paraburkholderia sp. LEh10]|jgi:SagB-type dehydrogenase family enzyme|uniref:SagB/ThcOx family dehydrogenase n=1 Tax=Paraburkholderia sp. LEh10 TaxID=2821353 RepID=UPI001AE1E71E|nr:SagB/ThcOx family dehydrogenase [Paraburkholderia sp. LEh10]MBP0588622.1 SagB/ThcOx family dehydrogenase [Paraburkholderia sp. LEh10]